MITKIQIEGYLKRGDLMKSTFLKVMGIIMTILGAIGIATCITLFVILLGTGYPDFIILGVIAIVQTVLTLVAGIIGITSSGDQHKAAGCIVWGIILIVIELGTLIYQNVSGYAQLAGLVSYVSESNTLSATISTPLSFVVPVLYLIAAWLFVKKKN